MASISMPLCACLLLILSGATTALAQAPGCGGLSIQTAASPVTCVKPALATGTVAIMNGNTFAVPIAQVRVTMANNVPVPPIYTLANCPTSTVPPMNGSLLGRLVCTFAYALPATGATSNPAAWTSVQASVTLANNNAVCTSPVGAVRPSSNALVMG